MNITSRVRTRAQLPRFLANAANLRRKLKNLPDDRRVDAWRSKLALLEKLADVREAEVRLANVQDASEGIDTERIIPIPVGRMGVRG